MYIHVTIVAIMLAGTVVLTVGWLLWMSFWAAYWRRRLRRKWAAEFLGIVMGLLWPATIPVGITVLAIFWFLDQMLGSGQVLDALTMEFDPSSAPRSPYRTHRYPGIHSKNGKPIAYGSGRRMTKRR